MKFNLNLSKKKRKTVIPIVIVVLIVAIIAGIYYYTTVMSPSMAGVSCDNGQWIPSTKKCEFREGCQSSFITCCFNSLHQQIDCNNPSVIIDTSNPYALYAKSPSFINQSITSIVHGFGLNNTGTVGIVAWIQSIVPVTIPPGAYTTGTTALDNNYSAIEGPVGSNNRTINAGSFINSSWSSGDIYLDFLSPSATQTIHYNITVTFNATSNSSYLTPMWGSSTVSKDFYVTREEIRLAGYINL